MYFFIVSINVIPKLGKDTTGTENNIPISLISTYGENQQNASKLKSKAPT